ncbi:MAG: type VI secretion system contractile sheath small subunit [Rhodospirillales bacterium]|nr:type VI secretion system contractile sheath small subunit [Rhodospirillales bacterium]
MAESLQHVLSRVRPPRVQITYDVETGGAIEKKELPYIVGIMADLSGVPAEPLPKVKDRKFVEIDRDNFNDVMSACSPRLPIRVNNRLKPEAGDMLNVELTFKSMDDFNPANLVNQVPALRKLYEGRQRLRDLLTKLDGNDELDALLRQVVENTESQSALREQVGPVEDGDGATPATDDASPQA